MNHDLGFYLRQDERGDWLYCEDGEERYATLPERVLWDALHAPQAQAAGQDERDELAEPVYIRTLCKALDAALAFAGTVAGGAAWWDDVWAELDAELERTRRAYYAQPEVAALAQRQPLTKAAADVLAERQRQISAEGWTPKHDDKHSDGSLALAAACYACNAATWAQRDRSLTGDSYLKFATPGFRWPWSEKWWKPKSQRQDIVRAAALLLAEIERLDREGATTGKEPGNGQ